VFGRAGIGRRCEFIEATKALFVSLEGKGGEGLGKKE